MDLLLEYRKKNNEFQRQKSHGNLGFCGGKNIGRIRHAKPKENFFTHSTSPGVKPLS
jgi:hypothetical protein